MPGDHGKSRMRGHHENGGVGPLESQDWRVDVGTPVSAGLPITLIKECGMNASRTF